MRVAVVGGGVAGALLAWRVRQLAPRIAVDVYTGTPTESDATGASGGLVRGFERALDACRLAADSLAELRGDPVLRESAGYREIGSIYLLPPDRDPSASVAVVDERLPGSATVGAEDGAIAVTERHAGYLSPARLRACVLSWLADGGVGIRPMPVVAVDPGPALRLADGTGIGYDAVVVAAGAWTPALLAASGLAAGGLRTKQIQYSVFRTRPARPSVFVDERTGLYGRPARDGEVLLGLPGDRWDVDPAEVRPDPALAERVAAVAGVRPHRTVASADCYHDPPGLELRDAGAAVFTFTGGSGGAAKTVLAASRVAAAALLG